MRWGKCRRMCCGRSTRVEALLLTAFTARSRPPQKYPGRLWVDPNATPTRQQAMRRPSQAEQLTTAVPAVAVFDYANAMGQVDQDVLHIIARAFVNQ